jgi:hypothetical protein
LGGSFPASATFVRDCPVRTRVRLQSRIQWDQMDQGLEREERFDLEAQENILGIASRLSTESLTTASLEDLVATGAELGLTRNQVEAAVEQYRLGIQPLAAKKESPAQEPSDLLSTILLAVLFLPMLGLAWYWLKDVPPGSLPTYLAFGLSLGLGLASGGSSRRLLKSLAGILLCSAASMLIVRVIIEFSSSKAIAPEWLLASGRTLLLEVCLLGAGTLVADLFRRWHKKEKPQAASPNLTDA